jgi:repeat uncharacterized protein DUF347
VLAFWITYILTRPLGASLGDYPSQPSDNGDLGLGTVGTSALFLSTIVSLVIYLTMTRKGRGCCPHPCRRAAIHRMTRSSPLRPVNWCGVAVGVCHLAGDIDPQGAILTLRW